MQSWGSGWFLFRFRGNKVLFRFPRCLREFSSRKADSLVVCFTENKIGAESSIIK